MKLLLLGATGLLGQVFAEEANRRGWEAHCAARQDAPIQLDVTNDAALDDVLDSIKPHLVINCAALVDIAACEADPCLAWRINARPLALLAEWSRAADRPLMQVSTDHFYLEGLNTPHNEDEPVQLINEYARTKYAGETLALTAPRSLVLRTSIVGIRGWQVPTFAEWAITAILSGQPMTLYSDAWTSSIDVRSFARAAFDLAQKGVYGLFNLAAAEVYSKEAFIRELARQMGKELQEASSSSVRSLYPPRAFSLGLDVTRVSDTLSTRLPDLAEVVASVLAQYYERQVELPDGFQ